jgi:predicted ArsR family transcriptional regulator
VRTHIAALGRDGIVEQVGTQRDTGGKAARVFALPEEGVELCPKAYARVLGTLVEEIGQRDGRRHTVDLLRAVGMHVASGVAVPADAGAGSLRPRPSFEASGAMLRGTPRDRGGVCWGTAAPSRR